MEISDDVIRPVPESDLDDLRARLRRTRRPALPSGFGWKRGTDPDDLRRLLDVWRDDYDWRRHEARIRALPWVSVEAGSTGVRALHQRSANAVAPAVLLLHGWPDSVLRFERLLPLLDDLHVVVPALPGYPFSHATETGMSVADMAELLAGAMERLGYDRYVVSGGDVGADVAENLATLQPERVTALHLTNVSPLHAVFADRAALGKEELDYLDSVAVWQRGNGGYIAEQSTKPHSLAPGLADSPAGLAAWLVEKLHDWSDVPFDDDDLLTWISAYWFTGTIGTSFTPYVEFAPPVPFVKTPTVVSAFAHDTKLAPRSFASRFVDVRDFVEHEAGGHFAAWERPDLYASDLRRAVALRR